MIDRSFATVLPPGWWRPASRVEKGDIRTYFLFFLFFLGSLPFAVCGWYRAGCFRVLSVFAALCARLNGGVAVGRHHIVDRVLLYPLFDRYWCRLAFKTYRYEPEIGELLQRAPCESIDLFLDGGANIGMWSKVASGVARDVVAVEASGAILPFLRRNARLGHVTFDVVEKALWSESDQRLSFCFSERRHAGASITDVARHDFTQEHWQVESVMSIAIDDLVTQRGHREGRGVLVLKIDVEGAEQAVIRGASETLASGRGLLIYEDHGKDASHEVTDYLLSRGTLEVYFWGGEDLRRVESLSQLQSIKRFRWLGYNFFCCRRGGVAEQLLLACFGNPR